MAKRASRPAVAHALSGILLLTVLALGPLGIARPVSAQESDPSLTESEGDRAAEIVVPSALAQFTTAVENREPVDQITFVANDARKIVFFSDLRGLAGQTILHRWIFKGEAVAEVPFVVGGPRWRVWSSKELLEEWIGDWTVEIVTEDGEVIAAETFTYSPKGN